MKKMPTTRVPAIHRRLLTQLILASSILLSGPLSAADTPTDSRTAILVPEKIRAFILSEMRTNLQAVQALTAAVAEEDFNKVASIAAPHGKMNNNAASRERRKYLPAGFRKMAPQMHLDFQAIARDARDFGDSKQTLEQLTGLLAKCNACHQVYRLESE